MIDLEFCLFALVNKICFLLAYYHCVSSIIIADITTNITKAMIKYTDETNNIFSKKEIYSIFKREKLKIAYKEKQRLKVIATFLFSF
ncbi:MAG: hypothetical protein M0C28_47235 [Candidatus Moduliflexus flocculans]|nr:hypothetical protein [Candidatus Moduliflexus flocculans]